MHGCGSGMRERGEGRAGWMRDGIREREGAGLDGCGSGMMERGEGGARLIWDWDEVERRKRGWMDARVRFGGRIGWMGEWDKGERRVLGLDGWESGLRER